MSCSYPYFVLCATMCIHIWCCCGHLAMGQIDLGRQHHERTNYRTQKFARVFYGISRGYPNHIIIITLAWNSCGVFFRHRSTFIFPLDYHSCPMARFFILPTKLKVQVVTNFSRSNITACTKASRKIAFTSKNI